MPIDQGKSPSSPEQKPTAQNESAIEPMTEEERTLLERLLEQAFATLNRNKDDKDSPPESGSNLLCAVSAKFLLTLQGVKASAQNARWKITDWGISTDWVFIGSACALGLTVAHFVGFSRGITYQLHRQQEIAAKLVRNVEKCPHDEKRQQMIYLGGFLDLEPQLLNDQALNSFYRKYFTGINLEYFRSTGTPGIPIDQQFPDLSEDLRHLLRKYARK